MARETIFEEQAVTFTFSEDLGYICQITPAPFSLTVGESYIIVWEGQEYVRTAWAFDSFAPGTVGLGNAALAGGEADPDGLPLAIGYIAQTDYAVFLTSAGAGTFRIGLYADAVYYRVSSLSLKAVANAIRAKSGTDDALSFPEGMVEAVGGITGGASGGSLPDDVHQVTFMNGGEELWVRSVADGDACADVLARGLIETPAKESTVQYDYTYSGWSLTDGGSADSAALAAVTEDRTVYAAYTAALRKYTVTYYDEDGAAVLHTEQLAYGAVPAYVPTKDGAVFESWTPAPAAVTGDASYTVTWSSVIASGALTSTASWVLDADGVLTVSGTGSTPNYSSASGAPWYAYESDITKVVYEDGITSIGDYAFQGYDFAEIEIAETVTTIGKYALNGCKYTSLTLPAGLTSLGENALANSSSLESLNIPAGITTTNWGYSTLRGLKSITVDSGNTALSADGTAMFNKETTVIYFAIRGLTEYTVPATVTEIADGAFQYCYYLAALTLPEGLLKIGQAFYQCNALTSITIPASVNYIKNAAFSSPLKSATFLNTTGWTVRPFNSSTKTSLSSSSLANATTAATYLTSTHSTKIWERS